MTRSWISALPQDSSKLLMFQWFPYTFLFVFGFVLVCLHFIQACPPVAYFPLVLGAVQKAVPTRWCSPSSLTPLHRCVCTVATRQGNWAHPGRHSEPWERACTLHSLWAVWVGSGASRRQQHGQSMVGWFRTKSWTGMKPHFCSFTKPSFSY